MVRHRSKSDILARYKERSLELVSANMNDIAQGLSKILLDDPPHDVPANHRKELNKFRGGLASELFARSPHRNTALRRTYEEIARSSLVLLDGPYDESGAGHTELLARWSAYAQQVQEFGFDVGRRIIILDGILDALTDPTLTLDYAVNPVLLRQGIIGSMFAKPPVFTPRWKGGYIIWSFMSAAVDVTDNLSEMRYSGRN